MFNSAEINVYVITCICASFNIPKISILKISVQVLYLGVNQTVSGLALAWSC